MRKLTNRFLSFMLVVVILVSATTTSVFAEDNQTVTVNGYTFEILNDDWENTQIAYNDGNETYIFTLNKMNTSDETAIEIHKTNTLARSVVRSSYEVNFDKIEKCYADTVNISDITLVDSQTGVVYELNENARAAFLIPVGVGLTAAAIEALLAIGAAVIIGGVAYVVVEEVAEGLKKQTEYRYFRACIDKKLNAVVVGDGIRTALAQSFAHTENKNGEVLATSLSYAKGITGGSYCPPENHGTGNGYWYHIHVLKPSGARFGAHIWYL